MFWAAKAQDLHQGDGHRCQVEYAGERGQAGHGQHLAEHQIEAPDGRAQDGFEGAAFALARGDVDGGIEGAQQNHEHDEERQGLGEQIAAEPRLGRYAALLGREAWRAAVGKGLGQDSVESLLGGARFVAAGVVEHGQLAGTLRIKLDQQVESPALDVGGRPRR
jgi:hypothetical protein